MQTNPLLDIVILAAGKGKRMQSRIPKVCQTLGGKPLLQHVIETANALNPRNCYIVYGHESEQIKTLCNDKGVTLVYQEEQLGTGHAVAQVLEQLSDKGQLLVLFGDVPLMSVSSLQQLIARTPPQGLGLLIGEVSQPQGLGRVVRDEQNKVIAIVEEKDATQDQKTIKEIFSGIMLIPNDLLASWWSRLKNDNAQKEFYLTDIVALAFLDKCPIVDVSVAQLVEILGVNDPIQLARVERIYQQKRANQLMEQGVILKDPSRLDIRGEVRVGREVEIDVNVVLEGDIVLGDNCYIGPNTVLKDTRIGAGVTIKANTVIEGAVICDHCIVGPFARLRPGTVLGDGVKVGNFVEMKQSKVGDGSKINHLSYIGDAELGKNINVGAGTITCNYDGVSKHQTVIEDGVFIGSGSQLVAPLTIGEGATIGAGSTVTKYVPPNTLVLTRSEQKVLTAWKRPKKVKI